MGFLVRISELFALLGDSLLLGGSGFLLGSPLWLLLDIHSLLLELPRILSASRERVGVKVQTGGETRRRLLDGEGIASSCHEQDKKKGVELLHHRRYV